MATSCGSKALMGHMLLLALMMSQWSVMEAGPIPNNGCPDGWIYYNFRCYHFVPYPKMNWEEGDLFCQNDTGGTLGNASLVSVETMDELTFLEKYTIQRTKQLQDIQSQQWWTGGYLDMDYYSAWVWGVPDADTGVVPGVVPFGLMREAWYPGEPNDENGAEAYISLRYDIVGLGLDDKAHFERMGVICEKPPLVQV